MSEEFDRKAYIARRVVGLLRVRGCIEDLAHSLIQLARLEGESKTLECIYGRVVLHVRGDHSVQQVRASYELQLRRLRLGPYRFHHQC